MLNKIKYKIVILAIVSLTLSGCFGSYAKKYEEGKAATTSAYNTTKGIFGGGSGSSNNADSKQAQADTQEQPVAQNSPVQNKSAQNKISNTPQKIIKLKKNPKFEYITIASPAPDAMHSVEFRAYKGLFLYPERAFSSSRIHYTSLLELKDNKKPLNKEKMKQLYVPNKNGRPIPIKSKGKAEDVQRYWAYRAINTARVMSTYPVHKKYMCSEKYLSMGDNCKQDYAKNKGAFSKWGSDFDKKRAFAGYLDNEFEKIFKIADKASHTIYYQGLATVSAYNFDRGGFVLYGIEPKHAANRGNKNFVDEYAKKYSIFKYKLSGNGKLLKMNESKAEQYAKTLEKSAYRLYYVYKVRLNPIKAQIMPSAEVQLEAYREAQLNPPKPKSASQLVKETDKILSIKMDFFYDEAMTKKAFSLPIK